MLPCRQVCLDFAEKCKSQLQYASTHGMTVALCDLLPVYDGTSDKCIMPRNLQSSNLCKLNKNIYTLNYALPLEALSRDNEPVFQMALNPLSPNIPIQILQTDLYIFP